MRSLDFIFKCILKIGLENTLLKFRLNCADNVCTIQGEPGLLHFFLLLFNYLILNFSSKLFCCR